MKRFFSAFLVVAFLSPLAHAKVTEVGELAPSVCYGTENLMSYCLADYSGEVQVLIYNAGWCPPCNVKMGEISRRFSEMENLPVKFVSISAEGWSRGTRPNQKFLGEWRAKHNIPFLVTGGHRDFGKYFQSPPLYIPFVAIIDAEGRLRYRSNDASVSDIFDQVERLLQR